MYQCIFKEEARENFKSNYETEKFDELDEAKKYLAELIANVIEDEIKRKKIDVSDTQYKKMFHSDMFGTPKIISTHKYNFETMNELYMQLFIIGYNNRFISCKIDYIDDGEIVAE